MLELCGGSSGISHAAFKRGLTSGGNLDLVTGCDLGDPQVQKAIRHYLDTCDVLVTVLQPNCRSTGPNSWYNSKMHYTTWKKHHDEDLPHIKFCGEVALIQIQKGRYFLREQPVGNWVDEIPPWTRVASSPHIVRTNMDQCMTGAIDEDGTPAKKPTQWMANHECLVTPLRQYRCDMNHDHCCPTNRRLEKLKQYPEKLCEIVVEGIVSLNEQVKYLNEKAFPTTETGSGPGDPATGEVIPRPPPSGWGCPACADNIRKTSPSHTRDRRQCRWYDVEPIHWKCPSCVKDRNRSYKHSLTPGECRFAVPFTLPEDHPRTHDPVRPGSSGDGGEPPDVATTRRGAHPRDPRPRSHAHPSGDASRWTWTLAPKVSSPKTAEGDSYGHVGLCRQRHRAAEDA